MLSSYITKLDDSKDNESFSLQMARGNPNQPSSRTSLEEDLVYLASSQATHTIDRMLYAWTRSLREEANWQIRDFEIS